MRRPRNVSTSSVASSAQCTSSKTTIDGRCWRSFKKELRDCLKRVAVRPVGRVHLGYEHTNIPNRSDRPPVGLYHRFDPCRETRRTAAQPGDAPSHQCDSLHSGQRRAVAHAADRLPEVAERLLLLPDLAY